MIGIFDSGVGGLAALSELRILLPREDIIYLADTKNQPYGIKRREELLPIIKGNLKLLFDMGADTVLMACCTASTLHPYLDPDERRRAVPIVQTVTECIGECERVTVIATEYTVNTRAFTKSICKAHPHTRVTEIATQELVSLVESGLSDKSVTEGGREYLDLLAERIAATAPDALILGCTHFSHVEGELGKRLPGVTTVSPAREGARLTAKLLNKKRGASEECSGRLTYLATRDK